MRRFNGSVLVLIAEILLEFVLFQTVRACQMLRTGKWSSMISLGDNIQSSWMGSESWKSSRSPAGIIRARREHPMLVRFISKSSHGSS